MVVKVHLFALLRERAGVGELTLPLPDGSTVDSAVRELMGRYPAMAAAVSKIAYAVNREYVSGGAVLKDGDELALIPPVSGG